MGTEQKVAVITGASQGIGAALVKAYRDRNYRIVATARSIKPSNDDDVLSVAGDIADPKTAERVIAEGMARFGRIELACGDARREVGVQVVHDAAIGRTELDGGNVRVAVEAGGDHEAAIDVRPRGGYGELLGRLEHRRAAA